MSLPENSNDKISSVKNETDGKINIEPKGQGLLKISDNCESTGAIPKAALTNKHTDEESKSENDNVNNLEALKLSPESSDDNICRTDWLRAKDSLENLIRPKGDKSDVVNSKSTSCTMTKEKHAITDSPHSESVIGLGKTSRRSSVAKVLSWDPWDKIGRKSKKESKKRKHDISPLPSNENSRPSSSQDQNRRDFKSGDEAQAIYPSSSNSNGYIENYEYHPYQKNLRSVDFTNKVMVVYVNEDKVVAEVTEPLKKELEQQVRNKEMRKGHMVDIQVNKRKFVGNWFKK